MIDPAWALVIGPVIGALGFLISVNWPVEDQDGGHGLGVPDRPVRTFGGVPPHSQTDQETQGAPVELQAMNVEGAPTLVYEVWYHMHPDGLGWVFVGYRVLSLRELLQYQDFGYHVERSPSGDRRDSTPLFPRLDPTGEGARDRMDSLHLPEP